MFRRTFIGLLVIVAILAAGWLSLRRADIPYETLEAQYANQDSQFLTLPSGIIVHYRDEGVRDAEQTLVLIHGFSASLHTWEPWVEELESDYRVISMDLPGHGLTRVHDNTDLMPTGMATFVNDVLNQIGVEDGYIMVGSSMGGLTSWTHATMFPDQPGGLVLVGASGWPEPAEAQEDEPFIFKLMRNETVRPLIRDIDTTAMVREGLEASFVDTSLVTDEMVARYVELSRAPGNRDALLDIIVMDREKYYASSEKLSAISVPTLIMHGDQDNLVPVEGARLFEAAIKGSEAIIYENIGHIPQEEIPARSVADLKAFLEGIAVETAEPEAIGGASELNPVDN